MVASETPSRPAIARNDSRPFAWSASMMPWSSWSIRGGALIAPRRGSAIAAACCVIVLRKARRFVPCGAHSVNESRHLNSQCEWWMLPPKPSGEERNGTNAAHAGASTTLVRALASAGAGNGRFRVPRTGLGGRLLAARVSQARRGRRRRRRAGRLARARAPGARCLRLADRDRRRRDRRPEHGADAPG